MKYIIVSHYDLDGVVSALAMRNSLRRSNVEPALTFLGYDKAAERVDNLITEFGKKTEVVNLLFLDFRLEPKLTERLLTEIPKCNLLIVDHHEWTTEDRSRINELCVTFADRLKFFWDDKYCGAELTQRILGSMADRQLDFLVFCTGVYDLWKTDLPEFREHGMFLNEMFWSLKPDGFIEEFELGYIGLPSPKCAEIWSEFEQKRSTQMSAAMENYSFVYELQNGRKILCVAAPDNTFGGLFTIYYPDYDYYVILKGIDKKSGNVTLSLRSLDVPFSSNDIAAEVRRHVELISGGGHHAAGGLCYPPSVDLEEAFNYTVEAIETLENRG